VRAHERPPRRLFVNREKLMMFLVELDHVKTTAPTTPAAGREFIERVIFPTLARAEQLVAEGKIVAGGVVAGRIALGSSSRPTRPPRRIRSCPACRYGLSRKAT
jgi:hypothetical protein